MFNSTTEERDSEVFHTLESGMKRSIFTRTLALAFALLLTTGVIGGYIYLRWRHEQQRAAITPTPAPAQTVAPTPVPRAIVYLNDAMIKGSQALISGTISNVSQETLKSLSVELELTKRAGGAAEKKVLQLQPRDLEVGQDGRYTILISRDYSGARLSKLLSGNNMEVPFKTSQGAKRPPEKSSATSKTIIVKRKPSKSGEDFINTPDTPIVIK